MRTKAVTPLLKTITRPPSEEGCPPCSGDTYKGGYPTNVCPRPFPPGFFSLFLGFPQLAHTNVTLTLNAPSSLKKQAEYIILPRDMVVIPSANKRRPNRRLHQGHRGPVEEETPKYYRHHPTSPRGCPRPYLPRTLSLCTTPAMSDFNSKLHHPRVYRQATTL